LSSPVIQPAVAESPLRSGEPEGTDGTGPEVIAEGRRVTAGLDDGYARMEEREERASKDTGDEDEGGYRPGDLEG
jgi:hypothetical protein